MPILAVSAMGEMITQVSIEIVRPQQFLDNFEKNPRFHIGAHLLKISRKEIDTRIKYLNAKHMQERSPEYLAELTHAESLRPTIHALIRYRGQPHAANGASPVTSCRPFTRRMRDPEQHEDEAYRKIMSSRPPSPHGPNG